MNYEKIKKDLISEIKLSENQAQVFLLVVMKGKMSVAELQNFQIWLLMKLKKRLKNLLN